MQPKIEKCDSLYSSSRLSRLLITLVVFGLMNSQYRSMQVSPTVCANTTSSNSPIVTETIFRDLIRVLEWDIGQHDLLDELNEEHNLVMQCMLFSGFNWENLMKCAGENYDKVIEIFMAEFFKLRVRFLGQIIKMLKGEGLDKPGYEHEIVQVRNEMHDDLDNDRDPDLSVNRLKLRLEQQDIESNIHFDAVLQKIDQAYLIYVSLKRLVKAYALMTIRCLQEFLDLSDIEQPPGKNYRLYDQGKLNHMFPDEEVERVFQEQRNFKEQLKNLHETKSKSFNDDLAKQGKFKNLVALHVAAGNIKPQQIEPGATPQHMFEKLILGKQDNIQVL